MRMRLGEPDASGRRRPIPIEGSEFDIPCDAMVAAIAQAPEISFLDPDHGLEITRWGTFKVNPQTLETNRPGIFAGGDAAAGPGGAHRGHCRRPAGRAVHRPLPAGRAAPHAPRAAAPAHHRADRRRDRRAWWPAARWTSAPRVETPKAPVAERVGDFREVELCLSEEQALAEAARCLSCGLCSECYQCVLACKAHAIDHQQAPYEEDAGGRRGGPGPRLPALRCRSGYGELGYGRYANVVTSMQFERLLSAHPGPPAATSPASPTMQEPKRIAFLQCVGSRDQEHDYCSSVCCMYATKEAMLALEHVPGVECHIFQMDMRAFSKGFDAYYRAGQGPVGIHYIRCKVSSLKEDPGDRTTCI